MRGKAHLRINTFAYVVLEFMFALYIALTLLDVESRVVGSGVNIITNHSAIDNDVFSVFITKVEKE